MEKIYLTLGQGQQRFYDEELNFLVTSSKPVNFIQLDSITSPIIEALNRGILLQVSSSAYNESIIPAQDFVTPEFFIQTERPVPFRYTKSPLNNLAEPISEATYHIIGPMPVAPFLAYKNYVLKKEAGVYKLYKPENGDVAYVTESPFHYWTYYGIWPTGFWVETKQEVSSSTTDSTGTTTPEGITNQVSFILKNLVYSQLDLTTRTEIPSSATIVRVEVYREGIFQYQGTDPGEYEYLANTKTIQFNTEVSSYERVQYIIHFK